MFRGRRLIPRTTWYVVSRSTGRIATFLGVDSLSILVHRSFQKPIVVSPAVLMDFWKEGSLERMEMEVSPRTFGWWKRQTHSTGGVSIWWIPNRQLTRNFSKSERGHYSDILTPCVVWPKKLLFTLELSAQKVVRSRTSGGE